MKKTVISLLFPIFFSSQCIQNSNFSLKKAIELHAKPAMAATSVGTGSYLLYDALITAADLQSTSQRNTQKAINVNTLLGTGFIIAGAWFFKHIWENEPEKSQISDSSEKNS